MTQKKIIRVDQYTFSLGPIPAEDTVFEINDNYVFDYPGMPDIPIPKGRYEPAQLAHIINIQSPEDKLVHFDGDEFYLLPPGKKKTEFQLLIDFVDRNGIKYEYTKTKGGLAHRGIRVLLNTQERKRTTYCFDDQYRYLGRLHKDKLKDETFHLLMKTLNRKHR